MSIGISWVVFPTSKAFNGVDPVRGGNRILDSFKASSWCKNVISNGRGMMKRQSYENGGRLSLRSSMVATPAGEVALTSEQLVYDVVLKQAALVQRRLKSDEDLDVKPDILLPGSLGLLSEAYERCREVCAEYAKTFYLGTLLMTPERRRAIWAIYGKAHSLT